ncbi:MAG: cobalt-precorrin-6A reductase [Rhodospirillales bacterium]|nr:cobalt-precorrin-6A reductase [Rhodospirillales bacterium]
MTRVLLLGGTKDARALAEYASGLPQFDVIYSLAGVTKDPKLPDCTVRQGGFGGASGLQDYLKSEHIEAVIDATHPFAAGIAANAHDACKALGLPRLKFQRPAWPPEPGDAWTQVPTIEAAARHLADHPCTAFLTIGVKELAAFEAIKGCRYLVRYIHAPDGGASLPNWDVVIDRGPFDLGNETALMQKYEIQALVTKNSGGDGTAKLTAARGLSIPVIMIDRPPLLAGDVVETEAGALAWLENH